MQAAETFDLMPGALSMGSSVLRERPIIDTGVTFVHSRDQTSLSVVFELTTLDHCVFTMQNCRHGEINYFHFFYENGLN